MRGRSLALAIPTYNRAAMLAGTLARLAPTLRELAIAVHVLDDSSNDETAMALAQLQATTGLQVAHVANRPRLGHDRNVIAALSAPNTDHVWLLGDALMLEPDALRRVHAQLVGQDFVFVNGRQDRPEPSSEHHGAALRRFLAERVWQLSLTGATIYSRRVVGWWAEDPTRQPMRNFPQLGAMLGFVAAHQDCSATWVGDRILAPYPGKPSYWFAQALEVWGTDWHGVISRHANAFGGTSLDDVLRSHSRHTGILSAKHLWVLRAAGRLTQAALDLCGPGVFASSSAPPWLVRTIASVPQRLAQRVVAARPSWQRRFPVASPVASGPAPAVPAA